MNEKKSKFVAILLFLILALASLLVVFFLFSKQIFKFSIPNNTDNNNIEEHFCTADAKQCLDGSYVSRQQDNNCQFALCPGEENGGAMSQPGGENIVPAETFRNDDNNLSFHVIKDLSNYEFVRAVSWPPKVTLSDGEFSCGTSTTTVNASVSTETINGREYCLSVSSEGAAGSIYIDYNYSTKHNNQVLNIDFTIQYPQCLNYDSPEQEACQTEETYFKNNVSNMVDYIVSSVNVDGDYKNATYLNGSTNFTFVNGVFEKELVPNSAEKMTINYLSGFDLNGDFNGDGLGDVAFIAVENDGGSGGFYSLYAYLSSASGYVGSNNILLGDRIKVQSINFTDRKLVVNYLDHGPTQAMADEPNILVSKQIKVSGVVHLIDLLPQPTF